MTDLSVNTGVGARVGSWSSMWATFKTSLWMLHLQRQLAKLDPRTAELVLEDGTYVSMPNGAEIDGTTFVVTYDNDEVRRVPASIVARVADNGDYGYSTSQTA